MAFELSVVPALKKVLIHLFLVVEFSEKEQLVKDNFFGTKVHLFQRVMS